MRRSRRRSTLEAQLAPDPSDRPRLSLDDGARIAVIGGGPAGSLFSYFALKMARTVNLGLEIDIYEPRHFTHKGPAGCNHCGGIISESLVQLLAAEGINIPAGVVQRGIDSYVLHMDVGTVRIDTPLHEKRIAAVYRGNGPRDSRSTVWNSFDHYLQELASANGAEIVHKVVEDVSWKEGRPHVECVDGSRSPYDLVVGAAGINSNLFRFMKSFDDAYQAPETAKTFITEFELGESVIQESLGSSMHVFLLDLPRLEFAALIPKGDCVTLCLLGENIDEQLVESFLDAPEVRACFPADIPIENNVCHCFPRINVKGALHPFSDRIVLIGDCGVTRLYKDGIGAAYRTAKAAATTAVFQGVSARDFRRHFWPTCRALSLDNSIGKIVFTVSSQIQKRRLSRRAVLRMTAREQVRKGAPRYMSTVLWDVFTGSAPYREVFLRTLHPSFWSRLLWNLVASNLVGREKYGR